MSRFIDQRKATMATELNPDIVIGVINTDRGVEFVPLSKDGERPAETPAYKVAMWLCNHQRELVARAMGLTHERPITILDSHGSKLN